MTTIYSSAEQLLAAEGQDLGATDWIEIDQARVNLFAEATGDHQWIHVDPVRAASGPFGGCIAHGYLTLSLVNLFLPQLIQVDNLRMGVNYGCDRVRFPAPVKVGARIRGRGEVVRVEQVGAAVQATVRVSVEIEGGERPGCVVDTISRYTFN
ncbi:3-hydroxyacyl-thioester dehydratase Z [Pseudomonas sp. OF001]|uniref:MaoC family dehydratase n=1 Tax=unclassified Pseudomonas TaxID=196821 RepID=UPI001919A5D1|nr:MULTISPECIES: MaoC family dehydratase [unclassified Pseudomonas]WPP46431.1 MaoC family dehydratase [Pseudomonas sp. AN-1]CAD5378301.1 3-hydroxyacyl-thioester dehydratase Z [Pseudomonas sp. OF001]